MTRLGPCLCGAIDCPSCGPAQGFGPAASPIFAHRTPEPIFEWPDGEWCYRTDYLFSPFAWRDDNFVEHPIDSEGWHACRAKGQA